MQWTSISFLLVNFLSTQRRQPYARYHFNLKDAFIFKQFCNVFFSSSVNYAVTVPGPKFKQQRRGEDSSKARRKAQSLYSTGMLNESQGHDLGSVFSIPNIEVHKTQRLSFINTNIETLKKAYAYFKHFEPKFLLFSKKIVKLSHVMNPAPTWIPNAQKSSNLPQLSWKLLNVHGSLQNSIFYSFCL